MTIGCRFVHLVGAYQVYMQPFMQFVEDSITRPFPALGWQKELDLPYFGYFPLSPLKLVSRTTIVVTTTLLVGLSLRSCCLYSTLALP